MAPTRAALQAELGSIAEQAAPYRNATSREDVDKLVGFAGRAKQVQALIASIDGEPVPAGKIATKTTMLRSSRTPTRLDVAKLFASTAEELFHGARGRNAGQSDGAREHLVEIQRRYPEDRVLNESSYRNSELLAQATTPDAITAAGGFCAPLEVIYDVEVIGTSARPVRDALPQFQAKRGGIQYRPAIDSSSLAEATGTWTAADDAAQGDDGAPVKSVFVVDCPDLVTAQVEALYTMLEFPNFTSRFDPEWMDAQVSASEIAAARVAENQLLSQILAGSKAVTFGPHLGAARDVLTGLDQAAAYYRSQRRLAGSVPLTWVAAQWVQDMLRADIARQQASADTAAALAEADSVIAGWFAARGVSPVWHLDGLAATTAGPSGSISVPSQTFTVATNGGALPAWPTKIDSALFATGSWTFLDGGVLNLGLVRDSTLNARNRFQMFVETFEGTAFTGVESLRPIFTVAPTGQATAPIDWA